MKWDRNRNRRCLPLLLHDPMTASLADRHQSILFENPADLRAEEPGIYLTGTST